MRIIKTTESKPSDTLGQLALYNGMDVLTLFEIHEGLQSEMREDHKRVYEFEMDQQSALIQMAMAGIPVDVGKRDELIRKTQAEKSRIESYMHTLLKAIGYYSYYLDIATIRYAVATEENAANLPRSWESWLATSLTTRRQWKQIAGEAITKSFQKLLKELNSPFNLNSNTQKMRLFYGYFGIDTNEEIQKNWNDFHPPWGRTKGLKEYRTRSSNGEYTPGVDRDTLEKLLLRASSNDPSEAAYWAQPFLNLCLHHADLAKTLQFLNCKLDKGWFYSSFGCVTETGRLSSKKSNYDNRGWNCFEPGAEALTPDGWQRLEEIKSGTLVMQWYPDGTMEWAPAEPIESYYNGNLHCLIGEQIGMSVTDNHRLALEGHHRGPAFYEATATELFKKKSPVRLQLSGVFTGGTQWNAPRLIAAYLADGSLENTNTHRWRCNFKKDRKIERIRELLQEDGLEWVEHTSSHPDIKLRVSFKVPEYYPTDWGSWIFDLTPNSAEALLDELAFWDGSVRGKSHIFFTAQYERAVWVQTLAHICGRGATIVGQEQSAASWSDTYMYKVNIKPRGWARVGAENKVLRPYTGPVYCLSVPSSYFLVRQHEKIAVTGNSQNITPPLRVIFTSPRGQKSATPDYEQIESRMVAARCFLQFGAIRYLAATECLTGDHEVLTPYGWQLISSKPDQIATWSPAGKIQFQTPLRWVEKEEEETYEINTKSFSIRATHEHRVPYYGGKYKTDFKITSMKRVFSLSNCITPTSGKLTGGYIKGTAAYRLLAAFQADGYISKTCVEFSFSKQRKIDRLHDLLTLEHIPYRINVFPPYANQTKPTTRFYIKLSDWPVELVKEAGPYLLNLEQEALSAYVEEHEFWDGSRENKKGYRLTSKNRCHLEWLATVAHLTGRIASDPIPDKDSWRMSIQDRDRTSIGIQSGWRKHHKERTLVYCPTVPSGFFLYRRKGHIAVSGNCGDLHSLACSMVWENLPWPEDFTVEWTIKHGPFPRDMIKAAKELAATEAYRGKSRRDCSKTLGHGSNYFGKPANMAKQSHIDFDLVQHYQDVYFTIFPEIKQWHSWIIEQVQVHGEYSTIFGRPRRFFGRPSDDATIREAIANDGQSPAADYTNRAMLRLHKASLTGDLPAELFLQKHDELGMRYKEEDESQVTNKMLELMEEHFTLTAPDGSQRDWYVPAEMLVGWNLGHRKTKIHYKNDKQQLPFSSKIEAETYADTLRKPDVLIEVVVEDKGWVVKVTFNPDGLIELHGTDGRVRQRDPFATNFLGRLR